MFGLVTIAYSIVFLCNAVSILHEERFLRKVGLSLDDACRNPHSGDFKRKLCELVRSIRTFAVIPLIVANTAFMLYELLLG